MGAKKTWAEREAERKARRASDPQVQARADARRVEEAAEKREKRRLADQQRRAEKAAAREADQQARTVASGAAVRGK